MKKSYITGKILWLASLVCLFSTFTACENEYKLELPLAVDSNALTLNPAGGTDHVLVHAEGKWTAELANEADASWAHLSKNSGNGNGEFVIDYDKNGGVTRVANILLTTKKSQKTIKVSQTGFVEVADVYLYKNAHNIPMWEQEIELPFRTNLGLALDQLATKVEYGEFDTTPGADNSAVEVIEATEEEPGWLTDVTVTEDILNFKVAENAEEIVRKARVTVYLSNGSTTKAQATAFITQEPVDGYFNLSNGETPYEVEAFELPTQFEWTTNLAVYFPKAKVDVSYEEPGQEWLQDLVLTEQGVKCLVLESKYDGERHAKITVSCETPVGEKTATIQVIQARPELESSYADLKALLNQDGSVTLERGYIMAYVVSEPGNPNLAMNVQPTWNTINFDENATTAYIESLDGSHGFRIKLDNAEKTELLPRYAKLKIALSGLNLTREGTPACYTITNFDAVNILESEQCSASDLPVNEIYIKDLTPDHIYTYVTFKDMEVAIPFGSWGNMHEGFALKTDIVTNGNTTCRCDCVFRFFRDINGDKIPMLINTQTSWRRPGARVPQGSGTVKGIVVSTPLARQNLNDEQGNYQFRVLSKDDIRLDETKSFSTRIAEWQWIGGTSTIKKVAGSDSKVLANYGTGTMDTDAPNTTTTARTGLTTSFMGYIFGSTNQNNGPTASFYPFLAFRYCGQWYNFTEDTGSSIWWDFSTKGLTGKNLTMTFTCGSGGQAQPCPVPEKWNFEYSIDGGATYTSIVDNLVIYPAPIYAYTLGDCPAWNAEYVLDLPDSLLGKENVRVRMKAATKKYLTAAGFGKGTLTATTSGSTGAYMRFDAVTIKYNK